MNVLSPLYLFVFIPLCILIFVVLREGKIQKYFLLLLSLFFVFSFGKNQFYLIIFLFLLAYLGALGLSICIRKTSRKSILSRFIFYFVILITIAVLLFFKYIPGIFENNISLIISLFKIDSPSLIGLIERIQQFSVPIGLSFLTFSLLSYIFDVFSGKIIAEKNPLNFALFVFFFPKFMAGPIERYGTFAKEITSIETSYETIYAGLLRFAKGLSKKVLLVGSLSKITAPIFALAPSEWNFQLSWINLFLYTLEIYLDFDAYSDMAIGIAQVFGIQLMENFNFPYLATSIQDFWKRWHISLSSWLRDYILIPFNFHFRRKKLTYLFVGLGILLTFFISGIWHGNTINFLLWGGYYGILLVIETIIFKEKIEKFPMWIKRSYTFIFVMIGWIFFKVDTFHDFLMYLYTMLIPQKFNGVFYRSMYEFFQPEILIAVFFAILISFGVFEKIKKTFLVHKIWSEIVISGIILLFFIFSIMRIYSGFEQTFLYTNF